MTLLINSAVTVADVLKRLPKNQKLMVSMFNLRESAAGVSHMRFLQDTGTLWLPKALVSRSLPELFEISFLEFVESAFFYYMSPLSAQHVFSKVFSKLSPDHIPMELLMKPVKELTQAERKLVLPIKAACVLSGLGIVTVSGEYLLNFVKNLLTEGFFQKSRFTDVVNLAGHKKGHPHGQNRPQRTSVTEHALKRIVECLAIGVGLFGASALLAKHGSKIKALEKPLEELMTHLDFQYDPGSGKFGLTKNHFRVMLPIAVLGYVDAARDRLEFIEVGIRASITAFYLGWGSDIIESWVSRKFGERVPGLMTEKKDVKKLATLIEESIHQAKQQLGSATDQTAVVEQAVTLLKPKLVGKSQMFLAPLLFSMSMVGLGVALMSRFGTQYRFREQQKLDQDFLKKYHQANPKPLSLQLPLA